MQQQRLDHLVFQEFCVLYAKKFLGFFQKYLHGARDVIKTDIYELFRNQL